MFIKLLASGMGQRLVQQAAYQLIHYAETPGPHRQCLSCRGSSVLFGASRYISLW